MTKQIVIRGQLVHITDSNGYVALGIVNEKDFYARPLVDVVKGYFHMGAKVTVSWFTSNKPMTEQELIADLISYTGGFSADYSARYSEITGYLWTNEYLKIGNHDLVEELNSEVGKYLHLRFSVK